MRSFAVLLSFAGLLPFAAGVRQSRNGGIAQAGPVFSRYRRPWHELELNLKKSGPWDVHLAIGGSHAEGNTSFRVDILP